MSTCRLKRPIPGHCSTFPCVRVALVFFFFHRFHVNFVLLLGVINNDQHGQIAASLYVRKTFPSVLRGPFVLLVTCTRDHWELMVFANGTCVYRAVPFLEKVVTKGVSCYRFFVPSFFYLSNILNIRSILQLS